MMILLFSITGLCLSHALIPSITAKVVSFMTKKSQQHLELCKQVVDLKNELRQICMSDNFATYAKTQRKIVKLEMEIKKETDGNCSKCISIKITISTGLKILLGLALLFCTLYYRYTPVLVLPNRINLAPLETMLSFPVNQAHAISVPVWIMISNSITRSVSRFL